METNAQKNTAQIGQDQGGITQTATPEFSYPNAYSVKGRVLGALLRGERLTHLDCWKRFGSARLAHHIYVLRSIGWHVVMVEKTVSTSDGGRPAGIGEYWLSPSSIQQAGEIGRKFSDACACIEAERRAA